ncbi:serine/threonine-protein kinase [Kribbella solani]|uniref:serine/threonine-protein kinase n=1 Tax=Kribbella solani TaxID=236067 RepID=UPI0029AFA4AD|nr:serine/threonine-protein kinase [Kribbella solani]MDX2969993.1 serine/threonine-protein kinase [Kribbella solani]MDX3002866.1 serine/threonine-protein kinase [Kribbella solani]
MNGEVLAGRYRLLTLLGRGGAGEVWAAEDTVLARQVALKLLRGLDGDPMEAVDRFRAEAQSAARLTHPNVVATYDVGTEGDHVFLVMELVQGPDLAQLMRDSGLPSAELIADIAVQGARALDAAHAAGVVHRDIKPANLMLTPDGTLKMTDFGIAKRAGNETTGLGVLLGTASYVSPEQVRGEPATPASDWYSFGCVLHELLTGAPPFAGPTVDVVMRQHLDAVPPPVARADVPQELSALVTHLLAKNPADRPSSAAQVSALLTPSNKTQVLTLPPADPAGVTHAAGTAGVTGAAGVVGVGKWEESEPRTHRAASSARLPLVKVGVAAAVVVVGVVAALLLRAGLSSDQPTAQAGGTPSAPVQKATAAPKTTPAPTTARTSSKPPSTKPTLKPTPQDSRGVLVQRLRSLAAQVRATEQNNQSGGHGNQSKAPREAAKDLDQAAEAVDEGDLQAAGEHFYAARQRLFEAQVRHRWQATPQIVTLFGTIGRTLPRPDSDNE